MIIAIYVFFQAKMYKNRFQIPLRELTTLPQILQSTGEGCQRDDSTFPSLERGPHQRGGPRAPNGVKTAL